MKTSDTISKVVVKPKGNHNKKMSYWEWEKEREKSIVTIKSINSLTAFRLKMKRTQSERFHNEKKDGNIYQKFFEFNFIFRYWL